MVTAQEREVFFAESGAGYSTNKTDCNDSNSAIHPGLCDGSNGLDDNCDGTIDDGSGAIIYYADEDGDGYGGGTGTSLTNNEEQVIQLTTLIAMIL